MAGKTELFSQWLQGSLVVDNQRDSTGTRFYVHSGTGSDTTGYGYNPDKPFASLNYARSKCTANKKDVVYLMPGHAETLSSAAAIVMSVAGVKVVSLGQGADRATLTFTGSATTTDLDVTANGVTFENVLFYANYDALANPLHIAAADCTFWHCEFRDQTTKEAARWILTTDAADRLALYDCFHNGATGGDASVNFARLVGVDSAVFQYCYFSGNYSVGVIELHTTQCTNVIVDECSFLETGTTDYTKAVVNTEGTSTYSLVDCWDAAADTGFSGGDAQAPASQDVAKAHSTTDSKVTSVGTARSTATSTSDSKVESVGLARSTATSVSDSKAESVGLARSTATSVSDSKAESIGLVTALATTVSTATSTSDSKVESVGTARSTATSTSDSKVESTGLARSTATSISDSKVESVGLVTALATTVSTATSTSDSKVESVGTATSTSDSKVESIGLARSTATSTSDSKVESVGLVTALATTVSTATSTSDSKVESIGLARSTATSTSDSKVESIGLARSTATSTSDSKVESVSTLVVAAGNPVGKASSFADNTLTNNTQVVTLATATGGDVYVEQIVIEKNGVALTGPTNLEFSTDNVYGKTGVNVPVCMVATASVTGNTTHLGSAMAGVALTSFVLESTKKLYAHGDDGVGSSAGNIRYVVIGRGVGAGATLV